MIGLKLSIRTSMDMYLYAFVLLLFCNYVIVPMQKGMVLQVQYYFEVFMQYVVSRIHKVYKKV